MHPGPSRAAQPRPGVLARNSTPPGQERPREPGSPLSAAPGPRPAPHNAAPAPGRQRRHVGLTARLRRLLPGGGYRPEPLEPLRFPDLPGPAPRSAEVQRRIDEQVMYNLARSPGPAPAPPASWPPPAPRARAVGSAGPAPAPARDAPARPALAGTGGGDGRARAVGRGIDPAAALVAQLRRQLPGTDPAVIGRVLGALTSETSLLRHVALVQPADAVGTAGRTTAAYLRDVLARAGRELAAQRPGPER
jgi:hypothetical protein